MIGNFSYSNATRLHFGADALAQLPQELAKYGPRVLLVYGGGSIKKNGIYDQVCAILKESGKQVFEDAGVMPNPTTEKLEEGCRRAREGKIDFILAVGGGSVCDYAKAVSVAVHCPEDAWERFYLRMEPVENPIVPLGCVLTMVGTGSEMNGGSVITNAQSQLKIGRVYGEEVYPKFSILNPLFTYSIPRDQMVAGFFDIFSHILEQYFSGSDDNTSDYLMEGLLHSLINSSKAALRNPEDYEARSNIMWIATWALNTLVEKGKSGDWMVHMLGHALAAKTDATHGMTLAALSLPYYRFLLPYGLPKFVRFAQNIWQVRPEGKSQQQIAEEGLARMEDYMRELGLVLNSRELGLTEELLPAVVEATYLMDGGYHPPTPAEMLEIFRASMH